jgi:VanZ family protein
MPQDDIPELNLFWWMTWIKPDKLAHAVIFGMQYFLLFLPLAKEADSHKTREVSRHLLWGVAAWGMATEIIQRFVPGRSFDWADWIADFLGIVLAFWFTPLIRTWIIKYIR